MSEEDLIAFEKKVAEAFEAQKIRGPVHLSGGNEKQLIEIFKQIKPDDWVLSTWRSHYHALLKGIPSKLVMDRILEGKSMSLHFPEYKFLTSAIMGGTLPIAVGIAASCHIGERVWCFIGDMAGMVGTFHDAHAYSVVNDLPIKFIIEDNGLSVGTPTCEAWGKRGVTIDSVWCKRYSYKLTYPHVGLGKNVFF